MGVSQFDFSPVVAPIPHGEPGLNAAEVGSFSKFLETGPAQIYPWGPPQVCFGFSVSREAGYPFVGLPAPGWACAWKLLLPLSFQCVPQACILPKFPIVPERCILPSVSRLPALSPAAECRMPFKFGMIYPDYTLPFRRQSAHSPIQVKKFSSL